MRRMATAGIPFGLLRRNVFGPSCRLPIPTAANGELKGMSVRVAFLQRL